MIHSWRAQWFWWAVTHRVQAGQSLVEYTLLLGLIGLVLVLGADSPLEALIRVIQAWYGRFTFALAMP